MSTATTDQEFPRALPGAVSPFGAAPAPAIRVLAGRPDEGELAALVIALAAVPGSAEASDGSPRNGDLWCDHARLLGQVRPGPEAWRTSTWVRPL